MDSHTTIQELRAVVDAFQVERNWKEAQTPKSLAMSIAIEAAELMEHFQWSTIAESIEYASSGEQRDEVAAELADVMIYCLSFANSTGIDVSDAIQAKMRLNAERFPLPEEKA